MMFMLFKFSDTMSIVLRFP